MSAKLRLQFFGALLGAIAFMVSPALLAAENENATSAGSPVGIWYGEGQPHDPNIVYLDEFNDDGTFRSMFRKYAQCEIVWQQAEEGRWYQEGDRVVTVTELINGAPIVGVQEYRNEGRTEFELRLRHLETDYLFIERRMDRFEFPGCFIGS